MTTKREEWKIVPTPDGRYGENWREIHADGRAVVRVGTFTRTRHGEAEMHAGVEISEADARRIAAVPDMEAALMLVVEAYDAMAIEDAAKAARAALRKAGRL
jgi:hypothetical protein